MFSVDFTFNVPHWVGSCPLWSVGGRTQICMGNRLFSLLKTILVKNDWHSASIIFTIHIYRFFNEESAQSLSIENVLEFAKACGRRKREAIE